MRELTELENEFVASLKALLVRYDASMVYLSTDKLGIVSNDADLTDEKFIFLDLTSVKPYLETK